MGKGKFNNAHRIGGANMTISDVLNVTGGNTNIIIYGINDDENRFMTLWRGQVEYIDFSNIPYGDYNIEHMSVVNGEDNLALCFVYPKLSEKEKDMLGEFAIGYSYPTEWIDKLYIKYRNFDKMREILLKSQEEVLKEILVLE